MTVSLPAGWTKRHNPIGTLGADTSLYDASGTYVGSYGAVPGYRGGDGWWECRLSRLATEQACIDHLIARAEK